MQSTSQMVILLRFSDCLMITSNKGAISAEQLLSNCSKVLPLYRNIASYDYGANHPQLKQSMRVTHMWHKWSEHIHVGFFDSTHVYTQTQYLPKSPLLFDFIDEISKFSQIPMKFQISSFFEINFKFWLYVFFVF